MTQKFRSATDFRRSLENRLQNIARETNNDLQRLRRKIAFDRLLARLFVENNPRFYLKGGYSMELRLSTARATKDIDLTFLERASSNDDLLNQIMLEELRELASKDLNDFLIYQIGAPQADLDNAPYGGARFPVSAFIDGRLFVRFQLDVAADVVIDQTETIYGTDWLGFCGIPSPSFKAISIEQQFAEKLHAYTLPRPNQRTNTRVKDLVDMVLLARMKSFDLLSLKETIRLVFKVRNTHPLPLQLNPPPTEWKLPFDELAKECSLSLSLDAAFAETMHVYERLS